MLVYDSDGGDGDVDDGDGDDNVDDGDDDGVVDDDKNLRLVGERALSCRINQNFPPFVSPPPILWDLPPKLQAFADNF